MRKRAVRFFFCNLLAGIVAIGTSMEMPIAIAQSLPLAPAKPNQDAPWWDLNQASPCGRRWCSKVGGLPGFTEATI